VKLYISCAAWGARKAHDGSAGLFLIDFDSRRVLRRYDCDICPGAARGFAGLTYDEKWLYAVRPLGGLPDEIVVLDPISLGRIRSIPLPGCHDVHQIDMFDGLLWITNTNHHEIVVLDPQTEEVVGRYVVLPGIPEERVLTLSDRKMEGDHRKRPHINSLLVSAGVVQAGLFGTDQGNFLGSQVIELGWERTGDGAARFHSSRPLPVNGFRYPHNVHVRADGTVIGCSSSEGEFRYGKRVLQLGGWPRGVAITPSDLFVGISSYSYGLSRSEERNRKPESNAAVVRIDRATLTIKDRYDFDRIGQLYEVRLAEGRDFGMSAHAHRDPGPPLAAVSPPSLLSRSWGRISQRFKRPAA
jgi:hypothetical protein